VERSWLTSRPPLGRDYPEPIGQHHAVRERALAAYQQAKVAP
jgi:deoxyribodipyrimidine photolyase